MLPDISMSGLTGDEPASSSRAARRSRDSQPSSVATNGLRLSCDFPNIIHLNVGGHRFTTTLGTLQADPQSMLGRMFSGEHPVLQDEDGSFVIDRDGRHFHHLLNYLRDGSVPIGLSRVERIELLREVDYFSLKTLYQIIGGPTVVAAQMSGGGGGQWLHKLIQDLARAEAADFSASTHSHRVYARLRWGAEYSGDWVVSSPRNLANVDYELYDACLARDPITALNKMGAAGFRPCRDPPEVPSAQRAHSDQWEIMMYKDVWQ
eukprot:TRINITY_DN8743_c0_g1_i3.p1 TRINITY_DN8743_c0_g1~~TRINITY_DN8743_c0_g1_i3.p1  ORF type:complete len:263 (+),score=31.59 TRINITY_DN8743_c0_g1_i3:132-920(+)